MDLATFQKSLAADAPPDGLSAALQALWHEANGDWHRAHELAQSQPDATGAWVHAYLHRVEGDLANAAYWYRNAEKPASTAALKDEWEKIAAALLGQAT